MLCTLHSDKWTELRQIKYDGIPVTQVFERVAHEGKRQEAAKVVLEAMPGRRNLPFEILHASSQGLMDIVINQKEGASGVADLIVKAFEATNSDGADIVKSHRRGIIWDLLGHARHSETIEGRQAAISLFDRIKVHEPKIAREEVRGITDKRWIFKKSIATVLPGLSF